ncbi:protein DEK isoform X4 [Syngnathoides biaculeatus]|uniref:protein DEK isoform X4 n=1 Tax=Syngnathoides biaculeatus TaxID=300417 RepID=UPI002ADE3531|nr:protein DEK isoform X4 [Syngnathoides biaculeatus]
MLNLMSAPFVRHRHLCRMDFANFLFKHQSGDAVLNNMADRTSEAADEPPETSREDASAAKKSTSGDVIVEGKRAKKSVQRLDMQAPKHKEKLTIAQGNGDKLGDIPRTNFHIGKLKPEDLKPLHAILFERPGKTASIKKNLRLFNGFPFHAGSERYLKKRDKLLKNSHFTNTKLKLLCGILDLEKKGTRAELVERIVTFLLAPKNNGKVTRSKKRSRNSAKKTSPVRKRVKRDLADDDQKAEEEERPDGSGEDAGTDDTSDGDGPSDGELTETVRALLADADLRETTVKIICQRVFAAFPDHDLSGRKDFIRGAVKSLIT